MAQAVLLQDVEGLGEAGTAIDVSRLPTQLPGAAQARPAGHQGSARGGPAPPRARGGGRAPAAERAEETTALLSKTVLTINHRAGEDGKLFGSVTSAEIAEAIQAARGIKVDRKKIRLEEPIRETGTYMVDVEVGGGSVASVKTIVAEMREGP